MAAARAERRRSSRTQGTTHDDPNLQKPGTTAPPDAGSSGEFSFGSLLRRPETGAFLGLLFVFVFFAIFGGVELRRAHRARRAISTSPPTSASSRCPIGLLMIAGELDISIGAMIPAGAMTVAIVSGYYGAPIIVGMAASLAFGVIVGLINGFLTVRTAVPSLIVTLGTLFAVQGLVLGLSVAPDRHHHRSRSMRRTGRSCCSAASSPNSFQVIIFWWLAVGAGLRLHHPHVAATATGSSPWAATRRAPATSASRPTG